MPPALRLCLVASVALVACGRTAPLSTGGRSPADASQSASDDSPPVADQVARDAALPSTDAGSPSVEVASTPPTPDAAALDAARADTALDARDVLAPDDGGRSPYRAIAVATGEVHKPALRADKAAADREWFSVGAFGHPISVITVRSCDGHHATGS